MKTRLACVVGLALLGSVAGAAAQPYGGYGPGYGRGGYDEGYRGRGFDDRDRRRGFDEDDRGYGGGRRAGFNEREYLRCHADVRRALQTGNITSAYDHYVQFGRREGRRLSC